MARLTSKRSLLVLGLVFSGLLFFLVFLFLGRLVVSVDPVGHADVIYVLGGSRVNRLLEAVRLYKEGYAPEILFSPGEREPGEDFLERQGIHLPNDAEVDRDVAFQLGVPREALAIVPTSVDNTAQEADAILPLAAARHWTRIIVITDRSSTRRAGFAFRRAVGSRLQVIVTCSRDDPFDPRRWWTTRWSFRSTFYEAPKLLAYWLGLKG